jgi:hypothetical protein
MSVSLLKEETGVPGMLPDTLIARLYENKTNISIVLDINVSFLVLGIHF